MVVATVAVAKHYVVLIHQHEGFVVVAVVVAMHYVVLIHHHKFRTGNSWYLSCRSEAAPMWARDLAQKPSCSWLKNVVLVFGVEQGLLAERTCHCGSS